MRTLLRNEQWKRIEHMLPGKVGEEPGDNDRAADISAAPWHQVGAVRLNPSTGACHALRTRLDTA
jgi:hypothetical protein